MKEKNIKSGYNIKFKIIMSIILIMMTIVMVFTATYSWYLVKYKAVFVMDVDASGILYLYLEVPVDSIGNDDRYLSPAVAMPYAVANGKDMNPLVLYNALDDTPSFVMKVASQKEYNGNFTMLQGSGITTNLQYKISMKSGTNAEAQTFSRTEFIYSDVTFKYYDLISDPSTPEDPDNLITIEVDPLISQASDNSYGLLTITGGQKVFFTVKIHFANVDELVDVNIMSRTSIWCELALVVEGL